MTSANLLSVFRQVSINGIIACGMTLCILTAGIDLSVGSVVALASVVAAMIANQQNAQWWICIPVAIGIGALCGYVCGLFIAYFNLAPFIMTLAMMSIARGLAFQFTDGQPVSDVNLNFLVLGKGDVLGIPVPALIFVGVAIITIVLLRYLSLGRHIYAVGGNEVAARNSGINVKKVKLKVYVLAGVLTGTASVVLTARLSAGLPQVAQGYELDAIGAVVIGGTSLMGGTGGIFGTVIGVLIIGFINNGMDLMNIQSYPQQIIKGVIIILAVLMDSLKNKKNM